MGERTIDLGPSGIPLRLSTYNDDAPGRPLVILHGFLEQGAAWQWVAAHLNRTVHAPDHRGHGLSGHLGPGGFYHFWDYVSDLDLLLRQLSPDAPVDLLGHSMGGTIASLYAGSRPERVHRLVLVEGLGPPDTSHSLLPRARRFLMHRREPPTHTPMKDVEEAAYRMRRHNPLLGEDRALRLATRITRQNPHGDGLIWTWDPRHRSRNPRPFVEAHFSEFLAAIPCPTLTVDGSRSGFPGAERAVHLPNATTATLDAGHLVHLDAPEALAKAIESHLGPATDG